MNVPIIGLALGCVLAIFGAVHWASNDNPDATSNTGSIKFSLSTVVAAIIAAIILLAVAFPYLAATWQQLGGK